jgi:hypothetical protein
VVVNGSLPYNYQSPQLSHAGIQFQHEHPEIAKEWHDKSKYLVHLSARDLSHLEDLIFKANLRNINISIFREPDIDNEITAVSFEPSEASRKLLSNLPLALREESQLF